MHNPMNRNPEENRPLDPFAAAEAPEMASETTYPVEADGEIHELTLDELIEAAAQGLSKHNAYVRRNRAANTLPNGQIYAAFVEEYPAPANFFAASATSSHVHSAVGYSTPNSSNMSLLYASTKQFWSRGIPSSFPSGR